MSPRPPDDAREIGKKLLEAGCRQGRLIHAPARTLWLTQTGDGQDWKVGDETIDGELVVASQDCDIFASLKTEPRVEAVAARWTADSSEVHTARKGNSARLFLLKEHEKRGFVADARRRVFLDKAALLGVSFESVFPDERSRMRFANWVAGRYNRPAIPNEHVDAVQKPVISAVGELVRKNGPLLHLLNRVAEIRFAVVDSHQPIAHLFIMVDEGDELSTEEEAELTGWLDEVLVKEGGTIAATMPFFRTETNISLHDYLSATRLQLDHFTPEDESA